MERVTTVTPEMLEAGFRVLQASAIADDLLEADRLWVEQIYLAMESCRSLAHPCQSAQ